MSFKVGRRRSQSLKRVEPFSFEVKENLDLKQEKSQKENILTQREYSNQQTQSYRHHKISCIAAFIE